MLNIMGGNTLILINHLLLFQSFTCLWPPQWLTHVLTLYLLRIWLIYTFCSNVWQSFCYMSNDLTFNLRASIVCIIHLYGRWHLQFVSNLNLRLCWLYWNTYICEYLRITYLHILFTSPKLLQYRDDVCKQADL